MTVGEGAAVADEERKRYHGRCYCGAVSFSGYDLKDIWYCHCTQCRQLTGHYMAACRALKEDVTIEGDVKWTVVSSVSEHGFCDRCSAPLFWRNKTRNTISIMPGNLIATDGLSVMGHIYVREKGDYYQINDDLPKYETYPDYWVR